MLAVCTLVTTLPILSGCDRTESKTKTTTTKVTETPDAVKKTTETTEKTVEKAP
jgi:hypothetical protein